MKKLTVFFLVLSIPNEIATLIQTCSKEAAGHLSCDFTDNCQYHTHLGGGGPDKFMCGDICTNSKCFCGNHTMAIFGYTETQQYCCIPPGDNCSIDDEKHGIVCSTGQILHTSESCHGRCLENIDTTKTNAAGHLVCKYTDYCNYEYGGAFGGDGYYMCGNECLSGRFKCICGPMTLHRLSPEYCCLAHGEACHWEAPAKMVCPTGQPLDKTFTCNGACYNEYHSSKYWGPSGTLACIGNDKCMPEKDWCKGVQCSEAAEECGEQLRCPAGSNITTLAGSHHYCDYKMNRNTRTYENIDRKDEDHIGLNSARSNSLNVSPTCRSPNKWCRSDSTLQGETFVTSCTTPDNQTVRSDDPLLCGNYQFMREIDCDFHSTYGRHCTSTIQHCVYPWYYDSSGTPGFELTLLENCNDNSDRIFHMGAPCPEDKLFLKIHLNVWNYRYNNGYIRWFDRVKNGQTYGGSRDPVRQKS